MEIKEKDTYIKYKFTGSVFLFGALAKQNWTAETYAKSPSKAINNLTYQAKQLLKQKPYSKITLKGKLAS